MALNSKHPAYAAYLHDWQLMRVSYEGERAVKAAGIEYLPPLASHVMDGMAAGKPGLKSYESYKLRARFPDYVSDAVEMFIGLLHNKPAEINLPAAMEPLRDKVTVDGEGLQALLRRINEQQLVTGRLGLLADLPTNATPETLPYIALYGAEAIGNWDNSEDHQGVNALDLVVLDETGAVRLPSLEWQEVERYRILRLGTSNPMAPATEQGTHNVDLAHTEEPDDPTEGVGERVYQCAVIENINGAGNSIYSANFLSPTYKGATLDQIPFVFINSKDITPHPDNPPLLGLGRLCMTIYRGEADYRQNLFMQGQDTLVVIGGTQTADEALRIGAGARVDVDIGGDAKYIGVSSTGLSEVRLSLENDRKEAQTKAGTLISPSAGKQESGDALTTRLAAQTASLGQIADAGACGLENILRIIALWMGCDPKEVEVNPNKEFAPVTMTGQDLTAYMAARTMGAPLSLQSLHGVFVDNGLTHMTYEDELEVIAEEELERAKLVASLPQPPAPPAPAPAPGQPPAPSPAPSPAKA
jgi:hypothetical protein